MCATNLAVLGLEEAPALLCMPSAILTASLYMLETPFLHYLLPVPSAHQH